MRTRLIPAVANCRANSAPTPSEPPATTAHDPYLASFRHGPIFTRQPQKSLAAWRQSVTHVEADRQAKPLELTHPALESGHVQPDAVGQIRCAHRLVGADHLQILPCPRLGRRVPAVQPGGDRIDIGGRQPVVGGEVGSFVGRKEGHRDHIRVPGRTAVQLLLRGLGIRIARGARLRGGDSVAAGDTRRRRRCGWCPPPCAAYRPAWPAARPSGATQV